MKLLEEIRRRFPSIEIVTPQFERADDVEPADVSDWSFSDWTSLRELQGNLLEELGMRPWSEEGELYLFPAEWAPHVPDGLEVVSILGEVDHWPPYPDHAEQMDRRFGVLAWGIERNARE